MELSIIIVNYNASRYLQDCLSSISKSLAKSTLSYELLVIDNNSNTDNKIRLYKLKKYRFLKIIQLNSNLGFGRATNTGIKKAKGKVVLLLNPDCLVIDDSIQKLYNFAVSHKNSFVSGRLYNRNLSPQPSAGPFLSFIPLIFFLYLFGETLNVTKYSPEFTYPVDWTSGAQLAGFRSVFNKVGLFDNKIFLYMEDMEFLYRAKKMGYSCIFFPEAKFIHYGTVTSDKKFSLYYLFSGILYFYRKHYSQKTTQIIFLLLYFKVIFTLLISYIFGLNNLYTKYKYAQLALKK